MMYFYFILYIHFIMLSNVYLYIKKFNDRHYIIHKKGIESNKFIFFIMIIIHFIRFYNGFAFLL